MKSSEAFSSNKELVEWVDSVANLTKPKQIVWCTGSDEENKSLIALMLADGSLRKLNQETNPNSFLHTSAFNDVARTEHLTFVCTKNQKDAGPNNNWKEPKEGHAEIDKLFSGCMQGRTMYVIPYCMGPIESPYARCGVEITDSAYVVANMRIMTRMGTPALRRIEKDKNFVKGLHSTGDLSVENRRIMHFPEELMIKSIGSGYGGNALLGKKCHALRIASWQARQEGWLAEHMLIVGIQNPQGETNYIVAAFPSACGKTNLAMLVPPEAYKKAGWKVWTVGDDIAWLHLGEDGRLWAINPEAGFFGVVPGTNEKTNPNALASIQHDTIFTNVALTSDNQPWWEGKDKTEPALDWMGRAYNKSNGPAAHPNSRFTVSAKQCPCVSTKIEASQGVPISAIVFGGRRAELAPLVYEARNWQHGVFMGASVASETTAAATGEVGIVRRDPMAMQPFCGYNFADYWSHWLSFGSKSDKLPKIFHVNWFRKDKSGQFMWPGFGDNIRVLKWILDRCHSGAEAIATPIGYMPHIKNLDLQGLDIKTEDLERLNHVDRHQWMRELKEIEDYFASYNDRLPEDFSEILNQLKSNMEMHF